MLRRSTSVRFARPILWARGYIERSDEVVSSYVVDARHVFMPEKARMF